MFLFINIFNLIFFGVVAFAAPPTCPSDDSSKFSNGKISQIFAGQVGHVTNDPTHIFERSYRAEDGGSHTFTVVSGTEELRQAIASGALELHPPGKTVELKTGTYTFVIFRDGIIATGRVDDSFEFGVKHTNLAFRPASPIQAEVVAAGEIQFGDHGAYEWNLMSGSITQSLVRELGVAIPNIERRSREAIRATFGANENYISRQFPSPQPSRESLVAYCQRQGFFARNSKACCLAVGIGCPQIRP